MRIFKSQIQKDSRKLNTVTVLRIIKSTLDAKFALSLTLVHKNSDQFTTSGNIVLYTYMSSYRPCRVAGLNVSSPFKRIR